VGLSTWFRHDPDQVLMGIHSPEEHGRIWKETLDSIAHDDLLSHILYVDLCNEWPLDVWAPFLPKVFKRNSEENADWMRRAIQVVLTIIRKRIFLDISPRAFGQPYGA
jgi:Sugar-binding cellulase-like